VLTGAPTASAQATEAAAEPRAVIPLLRRGSWYASLDLARPAGPGLPAVSLAPEVLIRADARQLRSKPASALPDRPARARMLASAWQQFAAGQVRCAGLGPQSYPAFRELLWAAAGLPASLVDRWCQLVADEVADLLSDPEPASPKAAGDAPALCLVALPANTFTCLYSVIEAALSGAAVWVRPSTREPFAALRLVCALLDQGWPAELIGYYPSEQHALAALVDVSDRQIVYGGHDVVAALSGTPTARLHGPLRVCALLTADADPDLAAAWLLDLVAGDAGRFCTAVRVILCRGDATLVGARLAALLDSIPLAPADARLPIAASPDADRAAGTAELIMARLGQAERLTSRPVLSAVAETVYLAPTLVRLPARLAGGRTWAGLHPLFGFEAPFPLATIMQVTAGQAHRLAGQADITHQVVAASPGRSTR
jgi:hypothetical protein